MSRTSGNKTTTPKRPQSAQATMENEGRKTPVTPEVAEDTTPENPEADNDQEQNEEDTTPDTTAVDNLELVGDPQEIDHGVNVQSLADGSAVLATNIPADVQPSGLSGTHPIETALQAPGGAVYHQGYQITPDPVNGPENASQAPSEAAIQARGAEREQEGHVGDSYRRGFEPDGVVLFDGTDARVPYKTLTGTNEIVVTQDVYRKVYPARSNRPTFLLIYPRGRHLPAIMAERDPDFRK